MNIERVPFKMIVTPCCGAILCYVNHRLPNFCSECGSHFMNEIRGCVRIADDDATLKYDERKMP